MLIHVCMALAPRSHAGAISPRGAKSPGPEPREEHGPGRLDHNGGAGGSAVPQAASVRALWRQPQPGYESKRGDKPARWGWHPSFLPALSWGQGLTSRYKTGRVSESTCLGTPAEVARGYRTPVSIVPLAGPHTGPPASSPRLLRNEGSTGRSSPHAPVSQVGLKTGGTRLWTFRQEPKRPVSLSHHQLEGLQCHSPGCHTRHQDRVTGSQHPHPCRVCSLPPQPPHVELISAAPHLRALPRLGFALSRSSDPCEGPKKEPWLRSADGSPCETPTSPGMPGHQGRAQRWLQGRSPGPRAALVPRPLLCPSAGCDASERFPGWGGVNKQQLLRRQPWIPQYRPNN